MGVWYNCTNQFIVQRCLGARSEWDARMGVVFAGFMKILLPLLVVIPGIVAFKLFPGLKDTDQAFPSLVRELVPVGLSGIVMAGLASGMLSHISSVLNSSSTVFTMDLYKPFFGGGKSEQHLVRVGRLSAFAILALATVLAVWFSHQQLGVFLLIQNVGAWVAAPIAAVFLLGVLWRRTTAAAATFVLLFGFPYTAFVEYYLFKHVSWLMPFDNWLNRTLAGVADFDGVAGGGVAVHPAAGCGAHPGDHLVVGRGEAAGVGARAEPGHPQPVAVVVYLHRHHGGLIRLCHLVPIRRSRGGCDRTFLMTVSYRPRSCLHSPPGASP